MKKRSVSLRTALSTALLVGVTLSSMTAVAQQKQMSVEQLEQYILEQKSALEEAIANREATEAKAREVEEALAEQAARREQLEKEVDELCLEHDAVEAGSYDDCKAQFAN
jgi:hypothetical protein